MLWPVEEIGIAEGDMPRAKMHLRPSVGNHQVARQGEETPTIDWRDRAVCAGVVAPTGRFDVAGADDLAPMRQPGVNTQSRQVAPLRCDHRYLRQDWQRLGRLGADTRHGREVTS